MDKNRILIVEDETAIGRMIDMNLKVVGYETVWFDDGDAVVDSLPEDHDFDLAVLDIMVPGKDGFQIMEELKPYEIPVIFLTAKGDIDSKVRGLSGGAEDYLVKPFEMLELLLRIEKILKRSKSSSPVIRVLDLEIDTDEHTVKKSGREISLKPMEFELITVLAKNKNRAISREKLLAMVWGTDFMGESRTVDVHIAQLRKKLDLGENIKTVSKLGYRLEE
jgi:DNA-binding response OmpR family regulator